MNPENMSIEDAEKIVDRAYRCIESPCQSCDFLTDHYCNLYHTKIVEDSLDVFIPCSKCESEYMARHTWHANK